MKRVAWVLLCASFVFASGDLSAQQQKQGQPSTATKLQYVTEGMFDLKIGQSMDLTDRKVLMTIPADRNRIETLEREKAVTVLINGVSTVLRPGTRLDLKRHIDSAARAFSNMRECFLDYIDLTMPKGAAPIATFRFNCN